MKDRKRTTRNPTWAQSSAATQQKRKKGRGRKTGRRGSVQRKRLFLLDLISILWDSFVLLQEEILVQRW